MIVAPEDFFPAARIIDYDEYTDTFIRFGYEAAQCVFQKEFNVAVQK